MRFLKAIYEKCRSQVGEDYPILIKINGDDNMKNGLKQDESIAMAKLIAELGFDGVEVGCGIAEDGGSTVRGDLPLVLSWMNGRCTKKRIFFFLLL
jgi:2,4-dienoyl-CoA reductase-like NADH-dependent reductase (Old Yellow Enzyme family)